MQPTELLQPVLFGTVDSKLWFHIITITDMGNSFSEKDQHYQ
jgi:hypothetical protein